MKPLSDKLEMIPEYSFIGYNEKDIREAVQEFYKWYCEKYAGNNDLSVQVKIKEIFGELAE